MSFFCLVTVSVKLLILIGLILTALRIFLRVTVGVCKCNVYLGGKTALVTGGNSGLGYQTALALAARGCRVIIADKDNADQTKKEIIEKTGNANVVTKQFNLASFASIRELARDINETEERLDILINNAGVFALGNVFTEDGIHLGMQVNHFGPFLLTHLLIGLLKKSTPSRIIFVSSALAFVNNLNLKTLNPKDTSSATAWSDIMVYGNSKLCNILTANMFATKLNEAGVTVNSLHPGMVYTPIFGKAVFITQPLEILVLRWILYWFAKSPEEGAQSTVHLAVSKEGGEISGKFFSDCKMLLQPSKAKDLLFAKRIVEASEKYVHLSEEEKL